MIMLIVAIFGVPLLVLLIVSSWKIYEKAGHPGWSAIVPIYNIIIWVKIAKRPPIWVALALLPYVSTLFGIILNIDVAKKFGKGTGYGIAMSFLPFIFLPILAFGDSTYQQEEMDETDHLIL